MCTRVYIVVQSNARTRMHYQTALGCVHLEAGEGVLVHSLVYLIECTKGAFECTPVHSLLIALVHSQVH